EGNCDASVPRSSGGSDRGTEGAGSAEQASVLASAHAQVPVESERGIATLGEGDVNRVLDGEPGEPSDAGSHKDAIVGGGGGVRVGVAGGGDGMLVSGPNAAVSQSDERDQRGAVWRRDGGVGDSGALCPDPEVTTSAPDG
ncbi:unnamed protein product, partial [Laminaria digitata]